MTLNDSLASALSVIWNAEKIGKPSVCVKPISNTVKGVLEIMQENGYIGSYESVKDGRGDYYKIMLSGTVNKCGVVKPRHAVKKNEYEGFEERFLPGKNVGIIIMSTPQGLMTQTKAKKQGIGGRLVAYCY